MQRQSIQESFSNFIKLIGIRKIPQLRSCNSKNKNRSFFYLASYIHGRSRVGGGEGREELIMFLQNPKTLQKAPSTVCENAPW
jgi:hypothetical protein